MRIIQVTGNTAINLDKISMITKDKDGFAVVSIGIEKIKTVFRYDDFLKLIEVKSPIGNGPNPTATALAY